MWSTGTVGVPSGADKGRRAGFDDEGGARRDGRLPDRDRVDSTDVGAPRVAVDGGAQVAALRSVEVLDVRVERRVHRLERRVELDREVRADRRGGEFDGHRGRVRPVEVL